MIFTLITEDRSGNQQQQHRKVFQNLINQTKGTVRIASAYVTEKQLLSDRRERDVHLLTFLTREDIVVGASSLDSLATLIKAGVKCRYLSTKPRLHSKVYIFGDQVAVVTSANLTKSALDKNIEVGVQLSKEAAPELIAWFDALWDQADELTLATVSKWLRETKAERKEYRRKKADMKPLLPASTDTRWSDLFHTPRRFFVCNTNRVASAEHKHEKRMHDLGYAAAWEPFQFDNHMKSVEEGDVILMFAKRVGIIGIGRAKGRCQILEPDDSDRIIPSSAEWRVREWRVPTVWLGWKETGSYSPWAQSATFLDVTKDKYKQLRLAVEDQFLGVK